MKRSSHIFKKTAAALLTLLLAAPGFSQETQDLLSMSLEDLLNIKIFSASKQVEDLFTSPLSSSVVTKEEIRNAGATSIQEAMRLVPGVMVREKTNGIYDIHLRGLGNISPNQAFSNAINTITLVMIDNRIVYNYLDGGTFWNDFAIDLNDVERIEVVRGPAAALYGPNAVAGVINIITCRPENNGLQARAGLQRGSVNTTLANGSLGYSTDTFSMLVSGNYQKRDRYQTDYYVMEQGRYIAFDDFPEEILALDTGQRLSDFDIRYPNPALAADKTGLNAFLNYHPAEHVALDISGGYADARVQNIYVDIGALSFATWDSRSAYLNLSGNVRGLTGRFSLTSGESSTLSTVASSNKSTNMDAEIEYTLKAGAVSLRPGVSFKNAQYDWEYMGGYQSLTSAGFGVRADYQTGHLRLVAGLRGDKYSAPDKIYPSYQFSGLYSINPGHLIRTAYSRANRAAFLAQLFFDMDIPVPVAGIGFAMLGNQDLALLTQDMIEIGYRAKWTKHLQTDIEGFYSYTRDYAELFENGKTEFRNGLLYTISEWQNLDLKAQQIGMTASLNYLPSSRVHLKAFITVQRTNLKEYAPDISRQDSTVDIRHRHTPDYYGGLYLNYRPADRLTLNVSAYTYGRQEYDHEDYTLTMPFPPFTSTTYYNNTTMKGKFLLNAKISYTINPLVTLFINARNILNDDTREFGFADRIGSLYLVGITVGQ
ncbi:TonB-dependent receptor plug domain-containing protein [bacterium]|nr:TonB-dependent receptor plug domain-containing protein [bacterium]